MVDLGAYGLLPWYNTTMMGVWLLSILITTMFLVPVHAQEFNDRDLLHEKILNGDFECTTGKQLIVKLTGTKVACVFETTYPILLMRGWGITVQEFLDSFPSEPAFEAPAETFREDQSEVGMEQTGLLLTLFNPPFESAKQHVKENDIVASFSFLKITDWPGIKAVGHFTVENIIKHTETADTQKVKYIVYDPEPFVTPIEELENVGQNINTLADIVHNAGFLYGIAPATETIINPRSSGAFKETDWTKVDLFIMQMQVYGRNNGPQAVIDFVNDVGGNAKQINPNLILILQVNASFQSIDDITTEISSLKNLIDGIAVLCYPNHPLAPCTEEQFNSVIDLR